MGIVWCGVRLVVPNPPRASAIVLGVLVMYLLAIPLNAPVARAAVMATLFCVAGMSGRRMVAVQVLAVSCVVCLVWRPTDLFTPGFQLSFGIVWALLVFTRPVAAWVWPPPEVRVTTPQFGEMAARWFVEFLTASVVAFAVALPVVAYHFGIISPLAVLLGVFATVPVTGLLIFGYLKVLVGLVAPSGSVALAGPVAWMADSLMGLVEHGATWPGASVALASPPTMAWTLAAVAAVVALLAGWFTRRKGAMACVGVGLTIWLMASQPGPRWLEWREGAVMTVTMVAVGDGSCFLVEVDGSVTVDKAPGTGPAWGRGTYVVMFDCGSAGYLDVGAKNVGPALGRLGIGRIDTLVVSHADLDHFSGVLDVVDRVEVGRVLVTMQMVEEGAAKPQAAMGFLLAELEARGVAVEVVAKGWRERVGGAELEVLWPGKGLRVERNNDASVVLSVRAGGRRVLLNGDIQYEAMAALLGSGVDLRADVTDLPHHGSFVELSPAWLAAVSPRVALQSSGPARLRRDRWAGVLAGASCERLVTARDGMGRVRLYGDGRVETERFRKRE